jgi:hypothetical protein
MKIGDQQLLVKLDRSLGREGHAPGGRTPAATDEERGPAVLFADRRESAVLADMTGDGLADITRIRNGEVCYWPNLGYGRFGAKVTMGAPRFDDAETLYAAGCTPPISPVRRDRPRVRRERRLHGLVEPLRQRLECRARRFDPVRRDHRRRSVDDRPTRQWNDLLRVVVDPSHRGAFALRRPGWLAASPICGYTNNLGTRVAVTYRTSTSFRLQDERDGHPWRTRLAFPVQCVARVDAADLVSGTRTVSEYRYHHGCFDVTEREFRGFGMVEQTDAEQVEHWGVDAHGMLVDRSVHCPPTLTKTWFHVGVLAADGSLLARYPDEHWDVAMRAAGFRHGRLRFEPELPDARLLPGPTTPADVLAGLTAAERREAARACKGAVLRTEVFALDAPVSADVDARRRALAPFTVTTNGLQLTVLQPGINGGHAVFATHENESLTRHYERNVDDPRAAHRIDVDVDDAGKVRRSVSVAYGRAITDPALPPAVSAQRHTSITITANDFTADVSDGVNHRLRLPSRSQTFEIRSRPGRWLTVHRRRLRPCRLRRARRHHACGAVRRSAPPPGQLDSTAARRPTDALPRRRSRAGVRSTSRRSRARVRTLRAGLHRRSRGPRVRRPRRRRHARRRRLRAPRRLGVVGAVGPPPLPPRRREHHGRRSALLHRRCSWRTSSEHTRRSRTSATVGC